MRINLSTRTSLQAALTILLLAASFGCHAQVPPAGEKVSPDLARRIEILIRTRSKIPPDLILNVGTRGPSEIPGYDKVQVTFTEDGNVSKPLFFLISKDDKTLGQFNTYDISKDPKLLVSPTGRPARGGPETAPVVIVGFDDLECPYCTRMHNALFPALTQRYGDQVRIVYKDFPLSIHPWAMRAAIDVNCVASQSPTAYWNLVDNIHTHAAEFGGKDKSLAAANASLDQLTLEEARKNNLKTELVEACIKKQDDSAIKASMKIGDDLGIEATPVLFINGEKLEGAYPLADVFRMIDGALLAAGQTPPPPYKPPTPPPAKPAN